MRRIRRRATTPAWPSAAPTAGPLAFALPSVLGGSVAAASAGPGENLCASDVLDHDPAAGQAPGVEGMKQYWRDFAASFPDFDLQVEVLTADNDHVTIVYRSTGTQQGDFLGLSPTGERIDVRGVQVARFADAKIVERWGSSDGLGLL